MFLVYFFGVMGLVYGGLELLRMANVHAFYALAIMVVGIWVISRISLIFPAIAIGEYVSLRASWRMTKPHQATMLMVVVFFPIAVWALLLLFALLAPPTLYLLEPVATVVTIVALSLAYASIRRGESSV